MSLRLCLFVSLQLSFIYSFGPHSFSPSKVDPATNTYSVDGNWLPLTVRSETIDVVNPVTRAKTSVSIDVRVSRFGPIITDNGAFDAGADVADLATHPLALSWTSIDKTINDTTLVRSDFIYRYTLCESC